MRYVRHEGAKARQAQRHLRHVISQTPSDIPIISIRKVFVEWFHSDSKWGQRVLQIESAFFILHLGKDYQKSGQFLLLQI